MKQTIIITANPDHQSATLYGSYPDKEGNQVTIVAEPWDVIIGELPAGKKAFKYSFNPRQFNTRVKIEWDWDGAKPEVIKKQLKVKEALMLHPHIEGVGYTNKRLILGMFRMEILEDIEKKNYESNKIYLDVINLVDRMSFQAKKDLVYFFGGNPADMKEHQVWMDLIGFERGRLLNENNAALFLKSIKAEQKQEVAMKITIKKAISFGIIETRDNKFWSAQNDLLGVDEDTVYLYYVGHEQLFTYIENEVRKMESGVSVVADGPEGSPHGGPAPVKDNNSKVTVK